MIPEYIAKPTNEQFLWIIISFRETVYLPLPKAKLTLTSYLGQNIGLAEGWVGKFPETYNEPQIVWPSGWIRKLRIMEICFANV